MIRFHKLGSGVTFSFDIKKNEKFSHLLIMQKIPQFFCQPTRGACMQGGKASTKGTLHGVFPLK